MNIHRDLGIRQPTAWFPMQRILQDFQCVKGLLLPCLVEADETYIGGKRKNMLKKKPEDLTG